MLNVYLALIVILCVLNQYVVLVRVHYDAHNWDMIQEYLLEQWSYSKINVLTRVRLISDMFVLAEAGEILYSKLFRTMKYLGHEIYFQPWKVALDEFALIRTRLIGTKVFEAYQVGWMIEFALLTSTH